MFCSVPGMRFTFLGIEINSRGLFRIGNPPSIDGCQRKIPKKISILEQILIS